MNIELVVMGHVAEDLVAGERRLGGAAAFAARAAACLGIPTALVTAAPDAHPLLAPLQQEPLITWANQPSDTITTFELDYSGPRRRISLHARAPSIAPQGVPEYLRRAPVTYVAPVIGECDRALVQHMENSYVVVGAQGWLRQVLPNKQLSPHLLPEALQPPSGIDVLVFSEQDHPESETLARRYATQVPVVALTRGAGGVTIFHRGEGTDYPALPATEQDPTGAGDVFGIILGLALHRGCSMAQAVYAACEAAARVVEGVGLGRLGELDRSIVVPEPAGSAKSGAAARGTPTRGGAGHRQSPAMA